MSEVIVRAEQVGKCFEISHEAPERYTALRDVISRKVKSLSKRKEKTTREDFWALKDVSFEINKGDAVGIIGRNGAGKSTLLKILSRITEPTAGRIELNGRVASLLEVGTGFHPELTGRENIFLNGAILGMSRIEIRKKFDEIVSFSGVEKFLDTPVKRYSSGMYVRLAFAVAAHLEPEILVVDEVLAVGDAEFQKKCLGKMSEVSSKEGRTVLFVSHNMAAVKSLCNRGIVLKNGGLIFSGSATESVNFYQSLGQGNSGFTAGDDGTYGNEHIEVLRFSVLPGKGDQISISSGISFDLEFINQKAGINLDVTFELKTVDDLPVFHHGAFVSVNNNSKKGVYKITGALQPNILNAGIYTFKIIFGESQRYVLYMVDNIVQFEVMNESFGSNNSILPGVIRPEIDYNIQFHD